MISIISSLLPEVQSMFHAQECSVGIRHSFHRYYYSGYQSYFHIFCVVICDRLKCIDGLVRVYVFSTLLFDAIWFINFLTETFDWCTFNALNNYFVFNPKDQRLGLDRYFVFYSKDQRYQWWGLLWYCVDFDFEMCGSSSAASQIQWWVLTALFFFHDSSEDQVC